jgi:uncharacterized protein
VNLKALSPAIYSPMFFVFDGFHQPWMQALESLPHALNQRNADMALAHYKQLFAELSKAKAFDLATAIASVLLEKDSSLSHYARQDTLPQGLLLAAKYDLEALFLLLKHDWQTETHRLTGKALPPLSQLANPDQKLEPIVDKLKRADASVLDDLILHYRQHGTGVLGQYMAFRWVNHELQGIDYPVDIDVESLVGLERQLGMLEANTKAFLDNKPTQHTLLYGPRGSGKSTAVRSLLKSYANDGLRLIELSAQDVLSLPQVVEIIRLRPHRYILFVDDLSFEQGDNSYHPLKTLLEGSLTARPENVLIYATSNRRHLIKEHFSDRPDPLNEDVHRWDTHNERLALSDRFGLTITFPDASQQRYLEIVKGLLAYEQLKVENLEERSIRFAEWGNGYSGRTAQQFVDSVKV